MFDVPKPRRFQYKPRFYDPEKERWEALKQKHADEHRDTAVDVDADSDIDAELAYFEERVRQLDRDKRQQPKPLGWRDLFRKREMPQFHYTPRFNADGTAIEETPDSDGAAPARRPIKIRRRFNIDDEDYLKPVSGGKIILYCFLVCLLLYWVLF